MSLFSSLRSLLSGPTSQKRQLAHGRGRRAQIEKLEGRALLSAVSGDFNNDRYADVVIGLPTETVNGRANAGAIQVIYGGVTDQLVPGLRGDRMQFWNQDSSGIAGVAEEGDRFGASLAVGDFNGDGFMDLAIGAPGEAIGSADGAGMVHILYGSRNGLTASGSQTWHQDTSGIQGTAAANDGFGSSLAVGDFNKDRIVDLAVGIPGDAAGSVANAGAVAIILGSRSKLKSAGNQLWHQDSAGIEGTAASGDRFGAALAAGDFNADAFYDLAIGAPGETVDGKANAGGINVLRGSKSGLISTGNLFWTADTTDVEGTSTAGGEFGFALTVGDFNDDSFMDLAVGAPGEDVSTNSTPITAGAVHVFVGTKNGLTVAGDQRFTETTFAGANAQNGDRFGAAMLAARLGQDRFSDLVIGTPNDRVGTLDRAGSARVLFGQRSTTAALRTTGSQLLHQNASAIAGASAVDEFFGSAFAAGDTNFDTFVDLIIEVPGESGAGDLDGGFTLLQTGSSGPVIGSNTQLWTRLANGTLESEEEKNLREGEAFLAANRLQSGVKRTASGLQYQVLESNPRNRMPRSASSQVRVAYTGTLLDGTEFDSSEDATFTLSGLIAGFREALLLMHEGDRFTIWIPSRLAYGQNGQGSNIGPNEVLRFDIELLQVLS